MNEALDRLAFDVAFEQLRGQKEDLRNLRNQASFGAAITGLISTVFATLFVSLDDALISQKLQMKPTMVGLPLEFWLVFIPMAFSLVFAVLVIISWRRCNFELNPVFVLQQENYCSALRSLAEDADKYFDENEDVIGEAKTYLWACLVLGWVQIPAWLLLIF